MKIRSISLALITVAIAAAAPLSAQPVTSHVAALPADAKLTGTGAVYSNSFLQERYMRLGRTIMGGLFIGGALEQAIWRATGKYEGKAPVRQEANALEALLGDFDVTGHVNERLRARMPEARHFDIEFTNDPALAEAVIGLASSEAKAGDEAKQKVAAGGRDSICAVKVSYGLGARAGREQFGFKKTYRPFVRLLGVVKKGTGEVIWHGAVIAWAKGYKGAEIKEIPREELLDDFKTATEDAISLFIRSLNGETLAPMGNLVDETSEDGRF